VLEISVVFIPVFDRDLLMIDDPYSRLFFWIVSGSVFVP
jgi:hypothetical protein